MTDTEQLQEKINALQAQLDAMRVENQKKWEPKGGEWFFDFYGDIRKNQSRDMPRIFGCERATEDEARIASSQTIKFNRLMAYMDEFAADYALKVEFDTSCVSMTFYTDKEIVSELEGKILSEIVEL